MTSDLTINIFNGTIVELVNIYLQYSIHLMV